MRDLTTIRHELQDRRLKPIAEATGLRRQTIAAVRDGESTNPSYETMRALDQYLSEREAGDARSD